MLPKRPAIKIRPLAQRRPLLIQTHRTNWSIQPLTLKVARRLELAPAPVRTFTPSIRSLPRPDFKRAERATVAPMPSGATDAYVDYRRVLTAEGGVLMVFKDLDLRLRHTLWRFCAWSASMAGAWAVVTHAPAHNHWITVTSLLATAIVNWLILRKPVEVLRSIEIRPDCMILEGADVFWLHMMEGGWPELQEDDDGNHILSGTYGTRFVEYLTVRRFDDEDRTPEVFAAHLKEAMTQLWGTALTLGTVQKGLRQ